MLRYLRLEIIRTFRDRRFVIMSVGFPVALYLLWSNVFGNSDNDSITGLSVPAYLMVALGSYGAMGAALSTTGPRLAAELQAGWLRQLSVTPLRPWAVIIGKALAAMVLTLPSLVLVGLAAALTQDVSLSAGQWVALLALLWAGTLPFVGLGILIGSAVKGDAAQPVMLACYLPLSILGGLWIPASQLPSGLRAVSHWTPSYRFAELGWNVVGDHTPSAGGALILAGWAVLLGGLAIAAYRRATVQA